MKTIDEELHDFILLNNCLRDMNDHVYKNKIENYGLDEETVEIIKNLRKVKKNNVMILGKAGVGKTAVIENLCKLINEDKVPKFLKDTRIIEMSLGNGVAGCRYRGDFEERITDILKYVRTRKDVILFIDEVHNLLRAGAAEGAIGAGDILKPFLARDEIRMIGATTIEEYEQTIQRNKAMDRRFTKLYMNEPGISKTIEILNKSKEKYEKHYGVNLTDKEIKNVVFKSKFRRGSFPDKAFDELDDYCYEKIEN